MFPSWALSFNLLPCIPGDLSSTVSVSPVSNIGEYEVFNKVHMSLIKILLKVYEGEVYSNRIINSV